jgi:hypothetical protein
LRKAIKIGEKKLLQKKALNYYKTILNFYYFGEILKPNDFYEERGK